MKVKEIMSQDVEFCTPDTPLQDVAQSMIDRDCGSIPVVDDPASRRLIGMVTDRDITVRILAQGYNPRERTARDCMTSPVFTLDLEATVDEAEREFQHHQLRRMPVIDSSNGACCGIITQADIARYAPSDMTAAMVKRVSQPAPTISDREKDSFEHDGPQG
jgi:CBS domain-containing protein